ncbi:MAG: alpha-amylase family glycosyl hydrolase, partial [Bacteroidota bacterium]
MFDPKAHDLLKDIISDLTDEFQKEQDFILRLSANFTEIFSCFEWLYGERHPTSLHLKELVRVLVSQYNRRSAYLKKRDLEHQYGECYLSNNMIGMVLYEDSFFDQPEGLLKRMNYLESLGINLIHILPSLKPLPVVDDKSLNPKSGLKINKALKEIIKQVHQRNMYLMIDLTINHTSDHHEWARSALDGDANYEGYYFTFKDRTVPDLFERTIPEMLPKSSPCSFT